MQLELTFTSQDTSLRKADNVAPGIDVRGLFKRHEGISDHAPIFLIGLDPAPFWFDFGFFLARNWNDPTRRQYAYTALRFARFLRDRGVLIGDLKEEDISDYRRSRTEGRNSITSASWSTEATVITLISDYCVAKGIMPRRPWIDVGRRNAVRQPVQRQRQIRGISEAEWFHFREVGMRGRTPSGGIDPSFVGKLAMRNILGAQLAVSTGMRLEEFHSLMVSELTGPPDDEGGIHVTLIACTKGGYERDVYVPAKVRSQALTYIKTERAALVQNLSGRTKLQRDILFIVDHEDPTGRWLSGTYRGEDVRRDVALMPPPLRRKTFRVTSKGLEPLALFTNSYGQMASKNSWHRAFHSASERALASLTSTTSRRGITPHALRHTFARHMLAYLEALRTSEQGIANGYGGIDPVVEVQRMLGHADRATTGLYIASNGLTGAVERAFHEWTDDSMDYGALVDEWLARGGQIRV